MHMFMEILLVTLITYMILCTTTICLIEIFRNINIIYLGKKRKLIKYYADKGFKYLRLESIPVRIYANDYNASYNRKTAKIGIGVPSLTKERADRTLNPYFENDIYIKDDLEKLKFTIFHEIGHYYLYTNHRYWVAQQGMKNKEH